MKTFDPQHNNWTELHFWYLGKYQHSREHPEWKSSGYFCFPETMQSMGNRGAGGYVWLCEKHYKEAVAAGYLW